MSCFSLLPSARQFYPSFRGHKIQNIPLNKKVIESRNRSIAGHIASKLE